MATYEYECRATGETREMTAPMSEAPTISFEEDGKTWTRVWRANAICKGGTGVNYGTDLPVSRSLPMDPSGQVVNRYGHQVRENRDGTYSTLDGSRIVPDKSAMDRHCAQAGYTHEPR